MSFQAQVRALASGKLIPSYKKKTTCLGRIAGQSMATCLISWSISYPEDDPHIWLSQNIQIFGDPWRWSKYLRISMDIMDASQLLWQIPKQLELKRSQPIQQIFTSSPIRFREICLRPLSHGNLWGKYILSQKMLINTVVVSRILLK